MFADISTIAMSLIWRNWTCKLALWLVTDTSSIWISMLSPNDRVKENTQSWLEIWPHNLASCPVEEAKHWKKEAQRPGGHEHVGARERASHSQEKVTHQRFRKGQPPEDRGSNPYSISYSGQVTSRLWTCFFVFHYKIYHTKEGLKHICTVLPSTYGSLNKMLFYLPVYEFSINGIML